jgi:uncharacterized protein YbjT (DUF2867 family)
MGNSQMIIVVAGAQGNLGKLVCDALITRSRSEGRPVLVRGLVRNGGVHAGSAVPGDAAEASAQHLAIVPVDYENNDDLNRACVGANCVVSALQGLEDVIVGVQSRLLAAAIANNVRRFVPTDFSLDLTQIPEGANRNFDLRLRFHRAAERLLQQSKSPIEVTSIYQGAFTELLGSGWFLFDYKKRQISYFGSPDTVMEFTTWKNTAEFTAAAAMDPNPTPRSLFVAGQRLTPKEAQQLARKVTGVDFELKRLMSVGMLRVVISLMKFFKPGKKAETMPVWVGMQYGYCMALGLNPSRLDNDRYNGIQWARVDDVIRKAFDLSSSAGAENRKGRP